MTFHIRDFNPKRELFQVALLAGVVALGVARGFWDLVGVAAMAYVLLLSTTVRRVQWRGRSLSASMLGPSVFREGWRALPRDILTLSIIVVVFPSGAVALALMHGDLVAWVGLGTGSVTALGALVAVALEIRRRRRQAQEPAG